MSDKMWIAHPNGEGPVEILEKQYYIWRQAGWRPTEAPPPPPSPAELAAEDLKKDKAASKKPAAKKK